MDDMDQFCTRDAANEGVRVPLYRPDGVKTDHWMQIRGVDSDTYRKAEAEAKRRMVGLAATDDQELRDQAFLDLKRWLAAHLVQSWSFETQCTVDNVVEFFSKAPQLQDKVDTVSGNRALFFATRSSKSVISQAQSSASTKSQKAPSSPTEPT